MRLWVAVAVVVVMGVVWVVPQWWLVAVGWVCSGLGVFFGRREIHIQKERGSKREEEMRLKLKNNKEIIFE